LLAVTVLLMRWVLKALRGTWQRFRAAVPAF